MINGGGNRMNLQISVSANPQINATQRWLQLYDLDSAINRNSSISFAVCESPEQRLSQENYLHLALWRRYGSWQIT